MEFESIEVRKVSNGFVVTVNTEEDTKEYVYDTPRRTTAFIKSFVDPKAKKDSE